MQDHAAGGRAAGTGGDGISGFYSLLVLFSAKLLKSSNAEPALRILAGSPSWASLRRRRSGLPLLGSPSPWPTTFPQRRQMQKQRNSIKNHGLTRSTHERKAAALATTTSGRRKVKECEDNEEQK
ncbi:hypothetical protein HPP92_000591 [Vanilla planifolia]|uniref:Uncharacterized protein n=1 Tax=Vanilla planifolia TaxID=51239 RepID=A0A835RWP7_VANPL|nr:hypothetical protein HPP92_000591 [Vanilla planifolia]